MADTRIITVSSPEYSPPSLEKSDYTTFYSLNDAIQHAESLNPSENAPVLIYIGAGTFTPPLSIAENNENISTWHINLQHIYFCGTGYEFTKINCDTITLAPDAITGFRDLQLDTLLELDDSFLPVDNVQVRSHTADSGQLDGVWRDAVGEVHISRMSVENTADTQNKLDSLIDSSVSAQFARIELDAQRLLPPDADATNTFVLKSGDTMTGPLKIESFSPAEKIVMSPIAGSTNVVADMRIESHNGTNFGFHIMFRATSNEIFRTADAIWFWTGGKQVMGIYDTYISLMSKKIKHLATPSEYYDAANKGYVDSKIDSVNAGSGLSGGGSSGNVTLNISTGDGITIAGDAVAADSSLMRVTDANSMYVKKSGDTMSGTLNMQSNPIINVPWPSNQFDAVPKAYVLDVLTNGETVVYIQTNDLQIISNNFYFTGDLILKDGQIWGLSHPYSNDNAATKLYVDTQNITLSNNLESRMSETFSNATHVSYNYVTNAIHYVTTNFVNSTGDIMTGYLTLNDNPTSTFHAATKYYVDTHDSILSNHFSLSYDTSRDTIYALSNWFADELGTVLTTGSMIRSDVKLDTLDKLIFYRFGQPRHSIGMPNSNMMNVLGLYANNILQFYTGSSPGDMKDGTLTLEIRPNQAMWKIPVRMTQKLTTPEVYTTGKTTTTKLDVIGESDWCVGTPESCGNIILCNREGSITTREGSGYDIKLIPDGTGEIAHYANTTINGVLQLGPVGSEGGEIRFAPHAKNPLAILDVCSWYLRLLSIDNAGTIRQVKVWDLRKGTIVGSAKTENREWKLPDSLPLIENNAQETEEANKQKIEELEKRVEELSRELRMLKKSLHTVAE